MYSGLYIHVPFCLRKCDYCAFHSAVPGPGDELRFLDALEREVRYAPDDFSPRTLYVGGGTPSTLSEAGLGRLLAIARSRTPEGRIREWTVEVNPRTLTPGKARILREAGVNRVSLGIQSFRDETLRRLGRSHDAREGETALARLREAGFANLSVDLIYGVHGVPPEALENDLGRIIEFAPEHVSCYALSIEPGTPLAEAVARGDAQAPDDDTQADRYERIRARLVEAGYRQYEISNFAVPGRACLHNLFTWGGGDYLGFGPAAHSCWRGARWGNVEDLDAYARRLDEGAAPRAFTERLDEDARARELLIMGLRRRCGVSPSRFRKITGRDLHETGGAALARFLEDGFLENREGRVRLADHALFVSDAIFCELI